MIKTNRHHRILKTAQVLLGIQALLALWEGISKLVSSSSASQISPVVIYYIAVGAVFAYLGITIGHARNKTHGIAVVVTGIDTTWAGYLSLFDFAMSSTGVHYSFLPPLFIQQALPTLLRFIIGVFTTLVLFISSIKISMENRG